MTTKRYKYNIFNESLESFYWLGFLYADGHFRGGEIKLELSKVDMSHLEKFKKFTNSNNSIKDNLKGTLVFSIYDSYHIPVLCARFGIKNNKTYNPPIVYDSNLMTDDQFLALFIGFIDGDGCISLKNNQVSLQITVHSSWLNNLKIIEDKILSISNISFNTRVKLRNDFAEFKIYKFKILKYLKEFSINNKLPVLTRKWDLIDINRLIHLEEKQKLYNLIKEDIKSLRENDNKSFAEIANYITNLYNIKLTEDLVCQYYHKFNKDSITFKKQIRNRPVYQYDKGMNLIKIYESAKIAGERVGIKWVDDIHRFAKNPLKYPNRAVGGYIWRYE